MSDSRKSFDEWMAIPVAEGADPANWIGSYAEAVAWETWQARDAEIATLQRELAAAKAENKHLHESLDVAAACATDKNRQLSALQLWQESVLVEVGQCPVESPQSRSSAYFQHRAEHLAARLVEAQSYEVDAKRYRHLRNRRGGYIEVTGPEGDEPKEGSHDAG